MERLFKAPWNNPEANKKDIEKISRIKKSIRKKSNKKKKKSIHD